MQSKGDKIVNMFIGFLLVMLASLCLLPFINIVAVSFSGQMPIVTGKVSLWPMEFQVSTYKSILKDMKFYNSLGVTVWVTIVGTLVNLIMTTITAYPLTKKNLKGKKFIMQAIIFTMLFSGGMIPTYLVVKQYGLTNSLWALIIPGSISTFNLIILKTFFQGIPLELEESAIIDGCGHIGILLRIFLPLSGTVLATLGLFYAVGHWNSYMNAMIYITDADKYTLQVRLRQLIIDSDLGQLNENLNLEEQSIVVPESMKAAIVIVSTLPILIVYPWLQKFFVKGVLIGAIKG